MSQAIFQTIAPFIGPALDLTGGLVASGQQSDALQQAAQIARQGTRDQLEITWAMFNTARNDLAPYRMVGLNGLREMERLIYGREVTDFDSLVQDFGPSPSNPFFTGNPLGLTDEQLSSIGLDPNVVIRFGPEIVGRGLFNRTNDSKFAATQGINQVGTLFWGDNRDGTGGIMGAVLAGRLTLEEAETLGRIIWGEWVDDMNRSGVQPDVINESLSTQTGLEDLINNLQGLRTGEPILIGGQQVTGFEVNEAGVVGNGFDLVPDLVFNPEDPAGVTGDRVLDNLPAITDTGQPPGEGAPRPPATTDEQRLADFLKKNPLQPGAIVDDRGRGGQLVIPGFGPVDQQTVDAAAVILNKDLRDPKRLAEFLRTNNIQPGDIEQIQGLEQPTFFVPGFGPVQQGVIDESAKLLEDLSDPKALEKFLKENPQLRPSQIGSSGEGGNRFIPGFGPVRQDVIDQALENLPQFSNLFQDLPPGDINFPQDLELSPLAQLRLRRGSQQIDQALASRGLLGSTAALQTHRDFIDQVLADEANQRFNRIAQLTGIGLTAAGASAGLNLGFGQQATNVIGQGANNAAGFSQLFGQNRVNQITGITGTAGDVFDRFQSTSPLRIPFVDEGIPGGSGPGVPPGANPFGRSRIPRRRTVVI